MAVNALDLLTCKNPFAKLGDPLGQVYIFRFLEEVKGANAVFFQKRAFTAEDQQILLFEIKIGDPFSFSREGGVLSGGKAGGTEEKQGNGQ